MRHKAFSIFDALPNGDWFIAYRDAPEHGYAPSQVVVAKSQDKGASWATTYIYSRLDFDARGANGGVTSNGTILLYIRTHRISGTGFPYEVWCLRSVDGGASFTRTRIYASHTDLIATHGKLVEHNGTIIMGGHRNPANAFITFTSTDDGVTHTLSVVEEIFPSGVIFTEPSLVHLGCGRVSCVARDNALPDSKALYCRTSDFGGVWSSVVQIPNITVGRNPLIQWFNPETNLTTVIWPSRKAAYMPSGGSGNLWPLYYTTIDADTLWAEVLTLKNWRNPTALPLYTPGEGDAGYATLVRDGGDTFMCYYKGNYVPGQGTDLFLAKISDILGGIV